MTTTTSVVTAPPAVRLPRPAQHSNVAAATVYDLANLPDERSQTLKHLLETGHVTVAPLRDPGLILHSHLPHHLGSGYALGADSEQMTKIYEQEISTLVRTDDERFVRDVLTRESWRKFLNQKPYSMALVAFFDTEVKRRGGEWKEVLAEYLYDGGERKEPLINGFIGGLGHPFIHLAYAYELQSPTVATEALSLGCTDRDPLHELLARPPTNTATYKTPWLGEVIQRVRADTRFDGLLELPGITNTDNVIKWRKDVLVEHWNAWEVGDPDRSLEQICDLSVILALGHSEPARKYDFYHAHMMTVAHALRVLWDVFPAERRTSILRQYALFTLVQYINQLRLPFAIEEIEAVDVDGRDWTWVTNTAVKHRWVLDEHLLKVVRAPFVFYETWGSKNDFYLKAAIKFITTFHGWAGYGAGVAGFDPATEGYHPDR